MNELTETIFNFLLGWVKKLFENIWQLFSNQEGSTWFTWLGDNWIKVVIGLCIGGLIIDLLVWFFRWRPDYVWRSVLRRIKKIFKRSSGNQKGNSDYQNIEDSQYRPYQGGSWAENQGTQSEDTAFYQADEYQPGGYQMENEEAITSEQTTAYLPLKSADGEEDATKQISFPKSGSSYQRRPQNTPLPLAYVEQFSKPAPDGGNNGAKDEPLKGEESLNPFSNQRDEDTLNINPEDPPLPDYDTYRAATSGNSEPWPVDFSQEGKDTLEIPALPSNDYLQDPQKLLSQTAPYPPRRRRAAQHGVSGLAHISKSIGSIAKKAGDAFQGQDNSGQLLDGLPPPVDKDKAFHQPVYPTKNPHKTSSADFQKPTEQR